MKLEIWGDSVAKGVIFDESRGRYAVCGDSCASLLSRIMTVRNRSVMGQTSADGLVRLRASEIEAGSVLAIEYGGNDCDLDWRAASEHPNVPQRGRVPIEAFEENLRSMISLAREHGALPVTVCPPPIHSERYFRWVSRGLDGQAILAYLGGDVDAIGRWQAGYADRIRAVAERMRVPVIDARSCFLEKPRLDDWMCIDGIHPNAAGQRMMFDSIAPLAAKII